MVYFLYKWLYILTLYADKQTDEQTSRQTDRQAHKKIYLSKMPIENNHFCLSRLTRATFINSAI